MAWIGPVDWSRGYGALPRFEVVGAVRPAPRSTVLFASVLNHMMWPRASPALVAAKALNWCRSFASCLFAGTPCTVNGLVGRSAFVRVPCAVGVMYAIVAIRLSA